MSTSPLTKIKETDALKISRGGFHSMRHGAASSLLADGATPAVVQRQLRHSDARITLGIYGHVVGDEQRTAVQNRSTRLVNRNELLESRVLLEMVLASRRKQIGLVGAVGIENTTRRNFKDLEGMLGKAKALKRNNWECKGILIGPLMAPRFFRPLRFRHSVFPSLPKSLSRLRAQISRRGWQADVTS